MTESNEILIAKLMFGQPYEQQYAMLQLRQRGFSEKKLNELKFSRYAVDTRNLTFKGVSIATPSFAERDYLCKASDYSDYGTRHYMSATPVKFTPVYKPVTLPSYKDISGFVPIAQLGLAVTATGSDLTLNVRNYEMLKRTAANKEFIANWNGQKVWKAGFRGNQHIPAEVVAAQKAAFESSLRTLKLVRVAGVGAAGLGAGISVIDAYHKGTGSAWGKAGLDIVMTGVAFIPGPGWIIAGVYFIGDAILSNAGINWWDAFLGGLKDAVAASTRAAEEHRRITGRYPMQGPKF